MKKSLCLLCFILLFPILLALSTGVRSIALAEGTSRYELTYEEPLVTKYVREGEVVTRKVYVNTYLYTNLVRITYDVVSSTSGEIMYKRLSPQNGKVSGENLTIEKENVIVTRGQLKSNNSGTKDEEAYYFEVSADHCCAFIFSVCYSTGAESEETISYNSKVLYFDTIDGQSPTITVKDINVFMYQVTCSFSDKSDICAASGVKSYIVYREDTTTHEKTTYYSSDKINRNSATFTFESGKYNYYVVATDAVGNVSEEKLVATFDVDQLIGSADAAIMTISSSPSDWSDTFVSKLEKAYSDYQIAANEMNGEVTEAELLRKSNALSSVLSEYYGYINDRLSGRINVTPKITNGDYLKETPTITNLARACDFVKYGEECILTIAIGQYTSTVQEEAMRFCEIEDVNKTYSFSIQCYTSDQMVYEDDFTIPLKLAFSIGQYEEIAAVQIIEQDGEKVFVPCNINQYTQGSIVLNVQKTYGDVYLFVREKEKSKLWYLLFLLIVPISCGTSSLIIIHKRKKAAKAAKSVPDDPDNKDKEISDPQNTDGSKGSENNE